MALITGACSTTPISVGTPTPTLSVKSVQFFDDYTSVSTTPITDIPSFSNKIRAVITFTNTGGTSTSSITVTMKNAAGTQLGMQTFTGNKTGDIAVTFGYVTGNQFGAATATPTTYAVTFSTSGPFTNSPLSNSTNVKVVGFVQLGIESITTTPSSGVVTGNTITINVLIKNTGDVPFNSSAYPSMKANLKWTASLTNPSYTQINTNTGIAMPSVINANGGTATISYTWQVLVMGNLYICCDIIE